MLRTQEVIFQTCRQRIAFQTDNALITLAFFRSNGNDQITITDQRFQVSIFRDLALDARHTTHLLIVVAVDHREAQRTITLELNGDITGELQRRREQTGGNQ
ncbi:hypothetical protein SDC9_168356 [bioreactor metagenome]|uniref:Uncharacterized protein n=1 Tax=bioreactor metagenome TaxID=1076179 RepID=A0A645G293_9ZZZZ